MPRRKRNHSHSMSAVNATTSVDDPPCSGILLQENVSKKKRTEPVGARSCQVVLNDMNENQLLQKLITVDGGENINKIEMFQKCNAADDDSDKKVSENEIPELRSVDGDEHQGKTVQILRTFTTVDTNDARKVFDKEIQRESQSGYESKTLGMSNKMLGSCDTADEDNGIENEITQECRSSDGYKNHGTRIQMLQKFVNPTVDAENVKDKEMARKCQSCEGYNNQSMMTKMLRKCNNKTVDALKNEMSQESMSVDEDGNPEASTKHEYVREHSRSVLRYRGSSTRGNFKKEADHDYCALFDDYSSDEEYVPADLDLRIISKSKLKYEEDSNWSPPNKKSGKRKREKRSSTTSNKNRIESGKSEDNDQDVPEHSNIFSDNSSKRLLLTYYSSNNKTNLSNFEKKKKKAQHLTNKSRSVHSKTFDLKASIQPLLQLPTTIETKSVGPPTPLLKYPTIETKSACTPKPLLQNLKIETKSDNSVKLEPNQETKEVQDDEDCIICFVGERKTTPEETLSSALLNKYLLHCKNYQSSNAEADSACMYCSNFIDLDAIKILAVADFFGDPKEYVEKGIQHAEFEFERLKNSAGKLLAEEQFKLKMVETRIKILKKAMDLLLEFGSFDYYVIESEMYRLHNT